MTTWAWAVVIALAWVGVATLALALASMCRRGDEAERARRGERGSPRESGRADPVTVTQSHGESDPGRGRIAREQQMPRARTPPG